jgi:hypothetical protein
VVGLFLLPIFQAILYRDDGLGVTSSTPRLNIVKTFTEQDLGITIEINLKRVNFLDVTLDLESGLYKPYRKPGDRPLYVSAHSNQPPLILKKKSRKKRITWFNPPYSMDAATNIGRTFLKLVDLHFPPGQVLHSVVNR